MTKTPDFSAMMKDLMGAFPVDSSSMDEAIKNTTALNEKLTAVAMTAAEKSSEISNAWAKDTLSKVTEMSKAKAEPADFAQVMTDFASTSAEVAAEKMTAFADVVKKAQMDTVDLMMAVGKNMSADVAVKKPAKAS
jgi:hypothetical protein